MDLHEALDQTATRTGSLSPVCKFIASLDGKQRAKVDDACASRAIQTAHLTKALELMAGAKFQQQAVGKHRRGVCNCGS